MLNKKHTSTLAKCRCGVAPLHIETVRYVGRILEDRVCFICHMEVESEEHVILHCNVYNDFCDELFLFACSKEKNFRQFSPEKQLSYLLSNVNVVNKTAKTLHEILERRHSILYN